MNCTSCGQAAAADDIFCGNCGIRLRTESPQQESFTPLPAEQLPKRGKKRRKKSGRKKFLRAMAVFALVSTMVIAASGWYVLSRFDDSQELSEVPDEIELSLEDGDSTVSIDTSSAKLALEQRSQGPQQPSGVATPVDAETTAQPTSSPEAAIHIEAVEETSGITILLMGVDADTSEQIDVGVRPDSLAVLHLDPENGTCRLLGIPKDSRVELPGYGMSKVNHALAIGGIPYQQLVVEQYLGISLDHYGLVDFEGLVGVVDSVGGITVINPYAFTTGAHQFAEGEVELDGEQALAFARHRGGSDGDLTHVDRQPLVIRAILRELGGVDAVRAVPSLLRAAGGHFKTDMSPLDLIRLANDYRTSCTSSTLETRNITGAIETHPDPLLNMNLSFVSTDPEDLDTGIRWLLNGDDDTE